MSPMKTATIRELRHETSRILAWIENGESVEVQRKNKPVAVLSPINTALAERPDFAGRLREIYGDHALEDTGTDLVSELRGER